ncbi:MAG: molybdopterin-dependent oxidoreductase [Burkholderiaceae bacterium]
MSQASDPSPASGAARRTPAFCTQCRSRCGCVAVSEGDRLVRVEPMPDHPTGAHLCPKGLAAPSLVHHPARLTRPLRRTRPKGDSDPGWQPVSWDEALDSIAARMGDIRDRFGPEQVAFGVTTPSGTHMSDGIAWVERFIRAFRSPNTIYATEICNWHKDFATRFTFGHDIGVPDFAHTDCILLWGTNPSETWLARMAEIRKGLRAGARMIVVDPRRTSLARGDACWLPVRPGTDRILALGLANLLIEAGRFDRGFVTQWTNGPMLVRADDGRLLRGADLVGQTGVPPSALIAVGASGTLLAFDAAAGRWLQASEEPCLEGEWPVMTPRGRVLCRPAFAHYREQVSACPPERVAAETGVPIDRLREAAEIIGSASSLAYFAWNGIGQSADATQTDRALALLVTLTGSYGRRGGNVPGAAAPFADLSASNCLREAWTQRALGRDRLPIGPPSQGWVSARDVYTAILDRRPYPVRMLFSFGGNLLAAQPDPDRARQALCALPFHVHADFFLNASAAYADIVLPVSTSWEREGLRCGFDVSLEGMRWVQLRPAVIGPVGQSRADVDIVQALARRLGLADRFFDGDTDRGLENALGESGITLAQLRAEPAGLRVAGEVALDAHRRPGPDGAAQGFPTDSRRIEIYSERLLIHGQAPVPPGAGQARPLAVDFPLHLSCAKRVAYCHGQHRHLPSLRRLLPDPPLLMPPAAAAARGIADSDWVEVVTPTGSFVARAILTDALRPDTVIAQHGWWIAGPADSPYEDAHAMAANVNRAMDTGREDPVSGSIPLRDARCQVRRWRDPDAPPPAAA